MGTNIAMLTLMAAVLAACSEAGPVITVQEAEAESPQSEIRRTAGMTVLGERIPNAYTPEAMGEALAMLKAETTTNKSADMALGGTEVTATHLYLRFAPRDSAEVALIPSLRPQPPRRQESDYQAVEFEEIVNRRQMLQHCAIRTFRHQNIL